MSDDHHYVEHNVYVHGLSLENALAALHPFGEASIGIVNYAPVQLWIHAAVWELFGDDVRAHHAVNVLLHVLASLLLVLLLRRSELPLPAAAAGGALFLLHPANVEAVAWISQLKSSACLALSLAALLAFPRRPGLGTALFALALLAKASAVFVLPTAALLAWTRREPLAWRWLAISTLLLAAYSVVELSLHQRSGAAEALLHDRPLLLLRSVCALALRYGVMATSSWGVSTFHEPELELPLLDPWWLASLVVLPLLGWRLLRGLRRRDVEAAWWVWAGVSFAPVSQIFPFLYPMADRYLYFVLPGLIGAGLLAGRPLLARLPHPLAPRALLAASLALLLFFAARSHQRAEVWSSPLRILRDAAQHYPEGVSAQLLRARRAAQRRDGGEAAAALRAAHRRGYNRFVQVLTDPALAPVREHPAVRQVVHEMAAGWIESTSRKPRPTQRELRMLAKAHAARGELVRAEAVLRRALEMGGRQDAAVRRDLEALAGWGTAAEP